MLAPLKYGLFGLGGVTLFGASFAGFAALSGAPMEEVAVIGQFFADPEAMGEEGEPSAEGESEEEAAPRTPRGPKTDAELLESVRGSLAAYDMAPPLSIDNLRVMTEEIIARDMALDLREQQLDEREQTMQEREDALNEQFASMQEMRTHMEAYQLELALRLEEVEASEAEAVASEQAGWAETSRLFAEGDVDEQSARLVLYTPAEAAQILNSLTPERARQLLNAIPDPQWKDYADAFSSAAGSPGN